ncbi:DUF817 family protein [Pasteurella canis]|nr:DUF817 family protein [Pasteurella canis]UAX43306.1 DUF817 family protein [Pasteurella canis]
MQWVIFIAIFITPQAGLFGLFRYDVLLIFAILAQFIMFYTTFETPYEIKSNKKRPHLKVRSIFTKF